MKPATTVSVVRRFFASGVQPAGNRQAIEMVDPGCFGPLLRQARLEAGLSQGGVGRARPAELAYDQRSGPRGQADATYEFMFAALPLTISAGVGSLINPQASK